jgi:hypothetical protein
LKDELAQYKVDPDSLWQATFFIGDGYEVMAYMEKRKWEAVDGWGKAGWNLGSWPLVIIFFRDRENFFDVVEYVEGDATMYACPTEEIREQITNELALFHWQHNPHNPPPGMEIYTSVDTLPDELKGPYRA